MKKSPIVSLPCVICGDDAVVPIDARLCERHTNRMNAAADLKPLSDCPSCTARAIVLLTPRQRLAQPDDTTHVCHPLLGGCNQGFTDSRSR